MLDIIVVEIPLQKMFSSTASRKFSYENCSQEIFIFGCSCQEWEHFIQSHCWLKHVAISHCGFIYAQVYVEMQFISYQFMFDSMFSRVDSLRDKIDCKKQKRIISIPTLQFFHDFSYFLNTLHVALFWYPPPPPLPFSNTTYSKTSSSWHKSS